MLNFLLFCFLFTKNPKNGGSLQPFDCIYFIRLRHLSTQEIVFLTYGKQTEYLYELIKRYINKCYGLKIEKLVTNHVHDFGVCLPHMRQIIISTLSYIALHIINYSYAKFHICTSKCLQPLLWLPTKRSIIDQSSLVRLKYQSMV